MCVLTPWIITKLVLGDSQGLKGVEEELQSCWYLLISLFLLHYFEESSEFCQELPKCQLLLHVQGKLRLQQNKTSALHWVTCLIEAGSVFPQPMRLTSWGKKKVSALGFGSKVCKMPLWSQSTHWIIKWLIEIESVFYCLFIYLKLESK